MNKTCKYCFRNSLKDGIRFYTVTINGIKYYRGKCVDCYNDIQKIFSARYYKLHRKKIRISQTKWYINNKKNILKDRKKYYILNRLDKINYARRYRKLKDTPHIKVIWKDTLRRKLIRNRFKNFYYINH